MLNGRVLFVGMDVCSRARVLEAVGYTVHKCECDPDSLADALVHSHFDAVIFQCLPKPPSLMVLHICRNLTDSPMILFADHESANNIRDFAFVVPNLCSPNHWLPELAAAIVHSAIPADPSPHRQPLPRTHPDHRYNRSR